jgi:hypothetical protein
MKKYSAVPSKQLVIPEMIYDPLTRKEMYAMRLAKTKIIESVISISFIKKFIGKKVNVKITRRMNINLKPKAVKKLIKWFILSLIVL